MRKMNKEYKYIIYEVIILPFIITIMFKYCYKMIGANSLIYYYIITILVYSLIEYVFSFDGSLLLIIRRGILFITSFIILIILYVSKVKDSFIYPLIFGWMGLIQLGNINLRLKKKN